MSQHDMDVANGSGATVRADLNNALQALATCFSGGTAPGTTFAYMWWADTANNLLKQRNSANSAWINVLTLSTGEPVSNTGPAFFLGLSANQGSAGVAYDKIVLDSETTDTNSNFASGRFTPTVAGYYQINATVHASSTALTAVALQIKKNTTVINNVSIPVSGTNAVISSSALIQMNGTTDYIELFGFATGGTSILFANGTTQMSGFLARSA